MKRTELKLTSIDNSIIFKGRLTNLPINEDVILQKSMEFFNDPAPCFIHRSAVMNRLYAEVEEFLNNGLMAGKTEWAWNELPYSLQIILRQKSETCMITYHVPFY